MVMVKKENQSASSTAPVWEREARKREKTTVRLGEENVASTVTCHENNIGNATSGIVETHLRGLPNVFK